MGAGESKIKSTGNFSNDIDQFKSIVNLYKKDDILELKNLLEKNNIIKMDDETVNSIMAKYTEVFRQLKDSSGNYVADTDAALYNFFNKDDEKVKKAKNTISSTVNLDDKFKTGLVTFVDNTSNINKKYKYFQYKYIELNLFFMAFVSNMYSIMNTYSTNVKLIEKTKYDELLQVIDASFQAVKDASLNDSTKDLEDFRQMSLKIKEKVDALHLKTIASMNASSEIANQQLVQATQTPSDGQVQQSQEQAQPQPQTQQPSTNQY